MFSILLCLCALFHCEWNLQRLAMQVNSANGGEWVAEVNPRFAAMSEDDFKVLLGAKPEFAIPSEVRMPNAEDINVPESFDARTAWPECETIGYIYDQGHCGSCWAMCAFEVLQDRICIESNGTHRPWLSAQDVTSCDRRSHACDGGWATTAFRYFNETGVALEECVPYMMGRCLHPGCSLWPTPKCSTGCTVPVTSQASTLRYHSTTSYTIGGSGDARVRAIQVELMKYGSVTGVFSTYEDIAVYKRGVYSHVVGKSLGLHAIKIVGWGVWDVADNERDDFDSASLQERMKKREEEMKKIEDMDPSQKIAVSRSNSDSSSSSSSSSSDSFVSLRSSPTTRPPTRPSLSSATSPPPAKPGDKVPYWIVVNSWGEEFGMDGLLLIRRGNNECGIEGTVVTGHPVLPTETHERERERRRM